MDRALHRAAPVARTRRLPRRRTIAIRRSRVPGFCRGFPHRIAIGARHPALSGVHLVDYRVRVLDSAKGTGSVTRVLIDSTNGERTWTTIGVSENIIAASWQALSDSIVYGLLHTGVSDGE